MAEKKSNTVTSSGTLTVGDHPLGATLHPPQTTTTATAAGVQKPSGTVKAAFHYPVVKTFTGKIQYRKDGAESQMIPSGKVLRAEVIPMRSRDAANGLVDNGQFSHVAADTQLGQPEEYERVKKPSEPVAEEQPSATTGETETTNEPKL
jgi:hypothetical protein